MGLFSSKKQKLYEKGRDAMRRGQDELAVQYLHQSAELGHPGAGMILGDFYRKGQYGLEKDYKKAAQYYDLNPEPWGRASLGMLYFYGGNGLEQNPEQAVSLFRQSLEAPEFRFYQAEGFLGAAYFWGRGVEQDYNKAGEYLKKYEKNSYGDYPDVDYCYAYLQMYGLGGVAKSPREGIKQMEEICRRAETPEVRLAAANQLWKETEDISGEDLNEAQVLRLEVAAKAGHIQAACKAATYYLTHKRVRTRRYQDEETKEWKVETVEKRDLWPQAAEMLQAALRCPKPELLEDKAALSLLLLWHGQQIKDKDKALHEKLLVFSR